MIDNTDGEDDELVLNPPEADRVAARAMVLAAVSCRALIEDDANEPGAEALRQEVAAWLQAIGVAGEMEADEAELISTPLGRLGRKTELNAGWRSEGMAVLAWALKYAELPPVHVQCEPAAIANAMGFLGDLEDTPLHASVLRDQIEIERRADDYLTLHWRLSQGPGPMDLVGYVSRCTWGPLRLEELEIVGWDLGSVKQLLGLYLRVR